MNHKLVYRLYLEEGLQVRTKTPKRKLSCQVRGERPQATGAKESWSMDCMADQLFDGRRFRLLKLVDNFRRESLAIRVGQRLTDDFVIGLKSIAAKRGSPPSIRGPAAGFMIAGADKHFVPATAHSDGTSRVVFTPRSTLPNSGPICLGEQPDACLGAFTRPAGGALSVHASIASIR